MFHSTSRLWALVVLLAFAYSAKAQIVPSSCTYDQAFSAVYGEGTWNSAYAYLNASDSIGFAMHAEIPVSLHDTIMACIAAVYNTNLPARDTVVNQLQITQFMPLDLRRFELKFDTSHAWTNQLLAGNITNTGNSFVDDLANQYGMVVEYAEYMPAWVTTHNAIARIRTATPINTAFMARTMLMQSGVLFANAVAPSGDGSQIVYEPMPGYNQITFRYGWEDCPAGCIYQRDWLFRVYPDCSVEYVASYGSLLTGTKDLVAEAGLATFPSPATDQVHVQIKDQAAAGQFQLSLLDINGRNVYTSEAYLSPDQNISVPLHTLPNGTYFLNIKNAHYSGLQKVIVLR